MSWIHQLILVGLGGGLGAICRFLAATWITRHFDTLFPWGTLTVNVLGCLLLGRLIGSSLNAVETWRLLLAIGFLGSFTTFSTFGAETWCLLRNGKSSLAIAYVLTSVLLGLVAVWLGLRLSGTDKL